MFFLGLIFILFTIIWILALGFLSPLGLFAGFIFGKIYGVIFLISGTAIGATLLYLFLSISTCNNFKIFKKKSYILMKMIINIERGFNFHRNSARNYQHYWTEKNTVVRITNLQKIDILSLSMKIFECKQNDFLAKFRYQLFD